VQVHLHISFYAAVNAVIGYFTGAKVNCTPFKKNTTLVGHQGGQRKFGLLKMAYFNAGAKVT